MAVKGFSNLKLVPKHSLFSCLGYLLPATIAANAEFYIASMSLLKFESVNIMFVGLGE